MKAEIWERKSAMFAPYSGAGLSAEDVAIKTGVSVPTVRRYAEKFGFDFTAAQKDNAIIDRIRGLAAEGKTRREAAGALGIAYSTVVVYGLNNGIEFVHASKDPKATARAEGMAAIYREGKTLEEIGDLYGITRERVRQLIKRHCTVPASEGGKAVTAARKERAAAAKRDRDSLDKYGCTYSEYMGLMRIGTRALEDGFTRAASPTGAYQAQRRTARTRGIEWNIKLWDWWQVWDKSGKWSLRGRTKGHYVMCRFGDVGAYEVGNVYIATCSHNCSVQPNNPHRANFAANDLFSSKAKQAEATS